MCNVCLTFVQLGTLWWPAKWNSISIYFQNNSIRNSSNNLLHQSLFAVQHDFEWDCWVLNGARRSQMKVWRRPSKSQDLVKGLKSTKCDLLFSKGSTKRSWDPKNDLKLSQRLKVPHGHISSEWLNDLIFHFWSTCGSESSTCIGSNQSMWVWNGNIQGQLNDVSNTPHHAWSSKQGQQVFRKTHGC